MSEKDINIQINTENTTHQKFDAPTSNAKTYNFQRPDKFSKDHLRGIFDTHKEFAHQLAINLTSYLRMQTDSSVLSVEQLTYEEYTNSLPERMSFGAFEFSPLPGQALIGISYEVLTGIVDRMLGGEGNCETSSRKLTDIEEALSKKVIEKTVKTLESVWKEILPVKCSSIKNDSNFSFVEIANKNEIVVLVTIEVQLNSEQYGLMNLCFPYPMLETVLGELANQHIYRTKGKTATNEEKIEIIDKLNPSTIDVEVILGNTDISLDKLIKLKVGDVIKLNQKIDDELVMKVNNNKKFFVKPGTIKNKISVKITDKYSETEDILKDYL